MKTYGIEKKILAITCDNASNNDTLVTELEVLLGGANSERTRVRCFAHVWNLVVKVSEFFSQSTSSHLMARMHRPS